MGERKRFRARYVEDPHVTVGARVVFAPGVVFEEWSMTGRVRPDNVDQHEPPFPLTGGPPPPEIETSPNLVVRKDATNRIWGHGRAN